MIGVFTDVIEPPAELAPFIRRLFHSGELRAIYADWRIELSREALFEDEHPGGVRHRHAIHDLVAWKPAPR